MENNTKKNLTRFFAACLALTLCTSAVDSRLLFPVNAEGEDSMTEETPAVEDGNTGEVQVPDADGEQGTTGDRETDTGDGLQEPAAPDPGQEPVSRPEEEPGQDIPVEQPEAEANEQTAAPETMSVMALQAARDGDSYLNARIVDTDGTELTAPEVKLGLGWIRDSSTLHSDMDVAGRHYSFKEVKYNNQTVVYTAKYNGQVYYSSNGVTAQQLPEGGAFDVVYWEYFRTNISIASAIEGVKPEDLASVAVVTEVLSYPDDNDKKLQKVLLQETIQGISAEVRVYKGNELSWKIINKANVSDGAKYVVKGFEVNGVQEEAQPYKNGGDFTRVLKADSDLVFTLGKNDKIQIHFESGSINSTKPDPLEFDIGKSISFSVTLNKAAVNDGDTFKHLYLKFIKENGEAELILVDVPEKNENVTNTAGGYSISISRKSSGLITSTYTYEFQITKTDDSEILDDLIFVADDQSNAWNQVTAEFDDNLNVAVYDNHHIAKIRNKRPHTVSLFEPKTFFISPETGFRIDSKLFTRGNDGLGNLSCSNLSKISTYSGLGKEEAIAAGYTHYLTVSSNGAVGTRYQLQLTSQIVPALFQRLDAEGQIDYEQSGTINSNNGPFDLPVLSDTADKVFAGWQLNDSADTTFRGGDSFTINKDSWNLGQAIGSQENAVQMFVFKPIFVEKDYTYQVEHYKQNEDGSWPVEASVSYVTSSAGVVNDIVLGIPEQFDGYHLDETYTTQIGMRSLRIKDGIPVDEDDNPLENPVIKLYYAKDIQHAHLSIHNHIEGDLANKNKKFSYQLIAKPNIENFPVDELTSAGFTKVADTNQYVTSVDLGHEGSHVMENLPITNCKYTVNLTTTDPFYKTTKTVKIDGNQQLVGEGEDPTTHTFAANTMTPNATHEVHFTHTASDVVPAGNLFDDTGFDLMLSATAVLGLLCSIYLILKKRIQA